MAESFAVTADAGRLNAQRVACARAAPLPVRRYARRVVQTVWRHVTGLTLHLHVERRETPVRAERATLEARRQVANDRLTLTGFIAQLEGTPHVFRRLPQAATPSQSKPSAAIPKSSRKGS
jgi:hypothetical protein